MMSPELIAGLSCALPVAIIGGLVLLWLEERQNDPRVRARLRRRRYR